MRGAGTVKQLYRSLEAVVALNNGRKFRNSCSSINSSQLQVLFLNLSLCCFICNCFSRCVVLLLVPILVHRFLSVLLPKPKIKQHVCIAVIECATVLKFDWKDVKLLC